MAQAERDQNRVPTLLAASTLDDTTPIKCWADPTTHRLLVDAEIQSLIEVQFPKIATGVYGAVTVTTSATLLRASNPDRISVSITNRTSEILYIGFDNSVTVNTGFSIYQQDVMTYTGSDLYTGALYGIVAASTTDSRYIEL